MKNFDGDIVVSKVNAHDNAAHIITKLFLKPKFEHCLDLFGVCYWFMAFGALCEKGGECFVEDWSLVFIPSFGIHF